MNKRVTIRTPGMSSRELPGVVVYWIFSCFSITVLGGTKTQNQKPSSRQKRSDNVQKTIYNIRHKYRGNVHRSWTNIRRSKLPLRYLLRYLRQSERLPVRRPHHAHDDLRSLRMFYHFSSLDTLRKQSASIAPTLRPACPHVDTGRCDFIRVF